VWDVLEYLSAPMLAATVERLFRIVKPGSYLLAFFQSQEKVQSVPRYSFRIQDSKTLLVADRGKGSQNRLSTIAAWKSCSRNSNR